MPRLPGSRALASAVDDARRHSIALGIALGWLTAAVSVDATLRRAEVVLVVLYAVAPLLAAAVARWRTTALFAVAAITLAAVSPVWEARVDAAQYAVRVADVVIISAVAVVVATVRVSRERRLSQMTAVATTAQQAVLPPMPTRLGELRMASRYRSAADLALVGGDLYDAVQVDGRVRVVVGDVRGKGLDAVGHAARAIRAFRLYAGREERLVDVARWTSAELAAYLGPEDFVTAVFAEVGPDGELTVLSCGHPPPALLRAGGEVAWLGAGEGPPLGVAERFGAPFAAEPLQGRLGTGDRLLLYTDGLTEARDLAGRFLPPDAVVASVRGPDVEGALDRLLATVDAHVPPDGHPDDIALVLLEWDGAALTGPARRHRAAAGG